MKVSPCKGCEDRMVGCHGICRSYKEWKAEFDTEAEWLRSHNAEYTEASRKRKNEWLKKRRGGKQRRIKDE